jgi:hypothetical protein
VHSFPYHGQGWTLKKGPTRAEAATRKRREKMRAAYQADSLTHLRLLAFPNVFTEYSAFMYTPRTRSRRWYVYRTKERKVGLPRTSSFKQKGMANEHATGCAVAGGRISPDEREEPR